MSKPPTLASLQEQIDELRREVQKLKDKNQRDTDARSLAAQIARGEVIR